MCRIKTTARMSLIPCDRRAQARRCASMRPPGWVYGDPTSPWSSPVPRLLSLDETPLKQAECKKRFKIPRKMCRTKTTARMSLIPCDRKEQARRCASMRPTGWVDGDPTSPWPSPLPRLLSTDATTLKQEGCKKRRKIPRKKSSVQADCDIKKSIFTEQILSSILLALAV